MFRYETVLLTLSLRFRRKEERHNLLCCLIHLAPNLSGPHRAHVRLAPASSKIDPSRSASKTRFLFSSNSHTNFRVLPVHDVTRTLSPSIVSDCYDIWVTEKNRNLFTIWEQKIYKKYSLFWVIYLMAYQPSWVI